MKLYDLFYQVGDKIIEKKNINQKELQDFLDNLQVAKESSLKVTQVKTRDDDEER